jgi:hypothetical protein
LRSTPFKRRSDFPSRLLFCFSFQSLFLWLHYMCFHYMCLSPKFNFNYFGVATLTFSLSFQEILVFHFLFVSHDIFISFLVFRFSSLLLYYSLLFDCSFCFPSYFSSFVYYMLSFFTWPYFLLSSIATTFSENCIVFLWHTDFSCFAYHFVDTPSELFQVHYFLIIYMCLTFSYLHFLYFVLFTSFYFGFFPEFAVSLVLDLSYFTFEILYSFLLYNKIVSFYFSFVSFHHFFSMPFLNVVPICYFILLFHRIMYLLLWQFHFPISDALFL